MGQRTQQIVDALDALTTQVARVAHALEAQMPPSEYDTCRRCGCGLVYADDEKCPVCKEPRSMELPNALGRVDVE